MAMMQPGMFLSQPGMEILASCHWPPMMVSMESAMRSRDWSEKLMPSVPMEMPSLTPTVLNRKPTSPAAVTPCFTCSARVRRCMLQVLPSNQTLAMPTWGFCMSCSVSPAPYSIAWDAPCDLGWVTRALYLFNCWAIDISFELGPITVYFRAGSPERGEVERGHALQRGDLLDLLIDFPHPLPVFEVVFDTCSHLAVVGSHRLLMARMGLLVRVTAVILAHQGWSPAA